MMLLQIRQHPLYYTLDEQDVKAIESIYIGHTKRDIDVRIYVEKIWLKLYRIS